LDANLAPVALPAPNRVNWRLLPPGKHPWAQVQAATAAGLSGFSARKRPVAEQRLQTLSGLQPDEVAVGVGGFSSYLAFEFKSAGVVVLESLVYGNATYVLGADWQEVSKLTKAEILDQQRHQARVIHRDGWATELTRLINPTPPAAQAVAA
jgi:hypothetical protein